MTQEYVITILIGIVLATYGYIFRNAFSKISDLESRPLCNTTACADRFSRIEQKQDDFEPVLNRIETVLSRLEAVIGFLQKDYDNRKKNGG